ncbi:MAG: hypothetical protein IPG39_18965 [Bacteroidetes bacterium]|nr:hypothetical protein [Bacteroidota bacterium]
MMNKWEVELLLQPEPLTASGTTEAMRINRNGFVGMGTTNPQQTLHVNGGFQFKNGTEVNGKILTSDINGVASWIPGPKHLLGIKWLCRTNATTNFIGTTDNQPLVFKVDGNILAGRIDQIHANVFWCSRGKVKLFALVDW